MEARLYKIRGSVQGVGFRNFVQKAACELKITGWAKNLADGCVEVHAQGSSAAMRQLEGSLWKGPRWAEVRGVETLVAAAVKAEGFQIK